MLCMGGRGSGAGARLVFGLSGREFARSRLAQNQRASRKLVVGGHGGCLSWLVAVGGRHYAGILFRKLN